MELFRELSAQIGGRFCIFKPRYRNVISIKSINLKIYTTASIIAFATGDSSVTTQLATQLRITISNEICKTRAHIGIMAISIVVSIGFSYH